MLLRVNFRPDFLQNPEVAMHVQQIMSKPVITIEASASVFEAAEKLLTSGISAAPVVDTDGTMIGIVSEADLMFRAETGTIPSRSWFQRLLADEAVIARNYVRSHSRRVTDVMTKDVVTAGEHADVAEVARLMKQHNIKRVPILRDGKLVGLVSRSNLLLGLLSRQPLGDVTASDDEIKEKVEKEIGRIGAIVGPRTNVVVDKGVVNLWGYVRSAATRDAMRVAAENVPGVKRVEHTPGVLPDELNFAA